MYFWSCTELFFSERGNAAHSTTKSIPHRVVLYNTTSLSLLDDNTRITWSRSLSLQDLLESTGTNVIAASPVASSCTRQPFVENSMQYPLLPLAVYNGKKAYSDYCLTSAPIPWKSEWIMYCLGPNKAWFSVFKNPLCCFSRDGPWQRFLGI